VADLDREAGTGHAVRHAAGGGRVGRQDGVSVQLRPGRDSRLRAFCSHANVRNLAEVDWTIEELRNLGIDAVLAPLPPRIPARTTMPLPERFTILLYLPQTRGDFYGRREYERLIRAFAKRNVAFIVVGGGDLYAPPEADVRRLGWCISLEDVYRDTTVLIRFTKHDGLSLITL